MLLAIDIGNTNMVVAVFDGEALMAEWRLTTDRRRTADEYAVFLLQLLQLKQLEPGQIDAAIVSSVVPATLFPLRGCLQQCFDVAALVVGEGTCELGMEVRIDRPHEAGADRLVNAVAARERYGPNLLILDFGTATTLDLLDGEGHYAGGIIAPGINLSMEALHRAAAKLPNVAIERPEKVVGTSTVSAMQSGLFYGYLGMIEGLITRVQSEQQHKLTVVATGGLAPLFAKETEHIDHLAPDLTIQGLRLLYHLNNKHC